MANRKNTAKREILPTSVRLTVIGKQLWDKLAERAGVSNAAYFETLLRREAKAEGIPIEETEPEKDSNLVDK